MSHRQVFVKVNALVDEGANPLVAALSCFERLVTLDSCQEDRSGEAYVSFQFGDDWHQLSEFVQRLLMDLGKRLELRCGFALRLEWFADGGEPLAQVRVAPKYIQPLATAIQAVAEDGL